MVADGTLRRRIALAALAERRLRESYLGRAASFYGWGIAVSYALLIVLAPRSAWALVADALATGASIVGTLAVGAGLREAFGPRERDALGALGKEAGFGGSEVRGARIFGAVWRAVKALAAPALALLVLGLAASSSRGAP